MPRIALCGGRGGQGGRCVAHLHGTVEVPSKGSPTLPVVIVVAVGVGDDHIITRKRDLRRQDDVTGYGWRVRIDVFAHGSRTGSVEVAGRVLKVVSVEHSQVNLNRAAASRRCRPIHGP